jgi:hypothetical protein
MNIVQHKSRNGIGLSDSKDGTKLVLSSLEVVIIPETFRFTYDDYRSRPIVASLQQLLKII